MTVRIPPLRERPGDTMLLARYFLGRFNREFGRNIRGFTDEAISAIAAHPWPGNVRELENRMKRAVVMADGRLIDAADLELAAPEGAEPDLDLRAARLRAEREVLQKAIARTNHAGDRQAARHQPPDAIPPDGGARPDAVTAAGNRRRRDDVARRPGRKAGCKEFRQRVGDQARLRRRLRPRPSSATPSRAMEAGSGTGSV